MARIQSFPPVANRDAEVLILGSMPGEASLRASRYYAHPQNAFWPIMAEVVGFDTALPYTRRLAALKAARIALWDVLHTCEREGSLDTRIRRDDEVANDFEKFFRTHPRIGRVLFNGGRAAECYRRHVLRRGIATALVYEQLPSTSPANASWSRARKTAAWRAAIVAGCCAPDSRRSVAVGRATNSYK